MLNKLKFVFLDITGGKIVFFTFFTLTAIVFAVLWYIRSVTGWFDTIYRENPFNIIWGIDMATGIFLGVLALACVISILFIGAIMIVFDEGIGKKDFPLNLVVAYANKFWIDNAAKSIAESLSESQKKTIVDSEFWYFLYETNHGGSMFWYKVIGNAVEELSTDEIIFTMIKLYYLGAKETIGLKICEKKSYQGEFCEEYLAHFAQEMKSKFEKDIAVQARKLAQKESLREARIKENVNAAKIGLIKTKTGGIK